MTIQTLSSAVDNVNHQNLEMANVFKVSNWNQLKFIYLRAITPYVFSVLIAGFGLTFKVVLASQVLAGVSPNYQSIGYIMIQASNNKNYDIILAWGMIAVFISLIFELILSYISHLCMPWKYDDLKYLKRFLRIK
jgi:ABC-type nitrate/sulfonate/bicarbonate transport system permease component